MVVIVDFLIVVGSGLIEYVEILFFMRVIVFVEIVVVGDNFY